MFFKHSLRHSFTLIEISVALAVIGIMSAVGISAYKATNPELKQDLKKMQAIESKLQEFFNTNGRLPFPARASDVSGSAHYLMEYKTGLAQKYGQRAFKCNNSAEVQTATEHGYYADDSTFQLASVQCPSNDVVWGVVPTRTLGLPDDYAYDSQGHNFEYITDTALTFYNGTEYGNTEGYTKANYTPSRDGRYQVYYTTENKNYKPFSFDLFDLAVVNNKTSNIINGTQKNIAYVLISKGKTNKCFWNNRSTTLLNDATIPTDNTKFNCQANYENGSFSELRVRQGYSKELNNIVKYKTLNEMVVSSYKADEKSQGLGSNNANTTDGYFNALPKGTMVLFYLNQNSIPQGWQICDGTNGTPDMRGYFVMGAINDSEVTTSDGRNSISIGVGEHTHNFTIAADNLPEHYHYLNVDTTTNGNHSHQVKTSGSDSCGGTNDCGNSSWWWGATTSASGNHTHNVSGYTDGKTYKDNEGAEASNEKITTSGAEDVVENSYNITNLHKKIYYICKTS